MDRRKVAGSVLAVLVVAVVVGALLTPAGDWLSIERLAQSRDWLAHIVRANPYLWGSAFFALCVVATALCFPAAPVIGITGGALFGFWPGLVIVTVASSIGSTIAFFDSRYLFRDWVARKLGRRMRAIDEGVETHGALYLLALRLNPLIPYWLVNVAMGLTAIRPSIYIPLTIAGLTPATFIYVQAGTSITGFDSGANTASVPLLVALFLISVLPIYLRALARFEPSA